MSVIHEFDSAIPVLFVSVGSLQNSGAMHVRNKMPRRLPWQFVSKKNCQRLSRNFYLLCCQWFRHTSAFWQGL